MKKPKTLSLNLCSRCKSDFETIGRKLIKLPRQTQKDSCNICRVGKGWEYTVSGKGGRYSQ